MHGLLYFTLFIMYGKPGNAGKTTCNFLHLHVGFCDIEGTGTRMFVSHAYI